MGTIRRDSDQIIEIGPVCAFFQGIHIGIRTCEIADLFHVAVNGLCCHRNDFSFSGNFDGCIAESVVSKPGVPDFPAVSFESITFRLELSALDIRRDRPHVE